MQSYACGTTEEAVAEVQVRIEISEPFAGDQIGGVVRCPRPDENTARRRQFHFTGNC